MKKILLGFLIVAALSACTGSKEKEMDMPTKVDTLNETVMVNADTLTEIKSELEATQQEADMMAEHMKMVNAFKGTGATVTKVDDGLHLTLPGDSAFKSGKAVLNDSMKAVLDPIAETLTAYPGADAMIKGHTDSSGSEEANQKLSEDRAVAVSKYLIGKGIDSSRIGIVGVGSSEPVDDNDTKEGKMANRRVDLTITY
ncbi:MULTISPECIES: OmpA family protein [Psychrilyobacter]|uniref:OmpA family protein n=1 Tax=Psychrilyobacter piezotolerans TaxID=2293438 RepID=A0ABX9KFL8_9FUSO|nr:MULTISPECIES: OmpA family protein [Psychrilyobacter]MCS5421395.1 OmpA family protein [Psychrilyobacter sp. S5]NDI78482.1 OmpA family protein [Psychrilyobacter piezotolerans]RDE60667.1 OmpA family protein [Psychrilyobacter sp. S5]REI40594.1 OmpA family protein [Psychrilyobacter piezotolerans]